MTVPLAVRAHFGADPVVASVRLVQTDRALFEEAAARVGERDQSFVIKAGAGLVLDLRPRPDDSPQEATLRLLLLASNHPDVLADELVRTAAKLPRGDADTISLLEVLSTSGARELGALAGESDRANFAANAAQALDALADEAAETLFELVDLDRLSPSRAPGSSVGALLTPGRLGLGMFLFLLYLAR